MAHDSVLATGLDSFVLEAFESQRFFEEAITCEKPQRKKLLTSLLGDIIPAENDAPDVVESKKTLLAKHLMTVARLAQACPFLDVRKRCQAACLAAKNIGFTIPETQGLSSFDEYIVPMQPVELFEDIFVQNGGVLPHLEWIMGYFPEYLECHFMSTNAVMRSDGPLPITWRYYIAILAAARSGCTYLVKRLQIEYLICGGEIEWLRGIDHAPQKLAMIGEFNAILAHQPWKLTREHIAVLARGTDTWSWSVGELAHAIIVMTGYHALAGFVLGSGVQLELDFGRNTTHAEDVSGDDAILMRNASATDTLRSELCNARWMEAEDMDREEEFARAGEVEEGKDGDTIEAANSIAQYQRYLGPHCLEHEDFNISSKEYVLIQQHEFSWKVHAMSVIEHFFPNLATILDKQFDATFEMTRNTLNGAEGVDTKPFRSAIWFYVLRIKGVCHDDFDYRLVNTLLNIDVKRFVKKVACTAHLLKKSDYLGIGYQFKPDERVHINLLVLESRRQAELLHSLNALAAYMK